MKASTNRARQNIARRIAFRALEESRSVREGTLSVDAEAPSFASLVVCILDQKT